MGDGMEVEFLCENALQSSLMKASSFPKWETEENFASVRAMDL